MCAASSKLSLARLVVARYDERMPKKTRLKRFENAQPNLKMKLTDTGLKYQSDGTISFVVSGDLIDFTRYEKRVVAVS